MSSPVRSWSVVAARHRVRAEVNRTALRGVVERGAVLAGKYRVERVLGRGGMGVVVQATHLRLQQPVAIKFLLPEVLGNAQIVARFLREAQATARLRSEHVARVIDAGTLKIGVPYLVLEYLEGADLSCFPRAQLTVGGIIDLALQACEALAEAHALGIVHRDIKLANLFVTQRSDGTRLLKVLDFGSSKTPMNGPLTTIHTVLGTPAYMSPEQLRSSRSVDLRSDIWSLGVVLYRLFQGAPPFEGDSFRAVALRIVNDPLPELTAPLPRGLHEIIYRCLEKDPASRFQNAAELAQAIAKYAESAAQALVSVQRTSRTVGAAALEPVLEPDPGPEARSRFAGTTGARAASERGTRWSIIAAMGVLACVTGAALAAVSGAPSPPIANRPPAVRPATVHVSPAATTPSPPVSATKPPDVHAAAVHTAPPVSAAVSLDTPVASGAPSTVAEAPSKLTQRPAPSAKSIAPRARPRALSEEDILRSRQ